MRSALARAAIRRGSSTMIFLFLSQGASSSASGTRVVLPAPGGATSTAALPPASVRANSSSTASMGRGVSKVRGNVSHPSSPAKAGDPVNAGITETGSTGYPHSRSMTATLASTPRLGRATNALVGKAERRHVLGAIDVAQIDDHGLRHLAFQPLKIERAELHPFRHDHQCVGAARARIGIIAIFDVGQFAARLLHADRVVRAHLGAHVEQPGYQRN